jgi:hypothetical protein
VVALDDYLAILGCATHAAALLELFAKCGEVVGTTHEATYYGSYTATLKAVEPYFEVLALRGECRSLLIFVGLILKVGICGEYHAQSLFPVVSHRYRYKYM